MHAVDKSMFKGLQWGDSISCAYYSKQCCRHNLGFDVSQVLSVPRLWKECLLLNSLKTITYEYVPPSLDKVSVTKSWHILITAYSTVPFRRNKLFALCLFLSERLWPRVWGSRQVSKCIVKASLALSRSLPVICSTAVYSVFCFPIWVSTGLASLPSILHLLSFVLGCLNWIEMELHQDQSKGFLYAIMLFLVISLIMHEMP